MRSFGTSYLSGPRVNNNGQTRVATLGPEVGYSMADSRGSAAMRAMICTECGPSVRLQAVELARPTLPEGHIRVAVHYCALGVADMLIMTGKYQVRPPLPFVPGSEVAGVVTEVGAGVQGFRVGDRVAGLNYTFSGGMAEEAIMPAVLAVDVPRGVPLRTAASLLVNYATASYALRDRGNTRPGERVLVLGAAGGVGIAAVELAKAMGARVIAAASTPEKLALARRHGAEHCINYTATSMRDELKSYGGVDVVIDPVGGEYSEQALRALRPGGRLLVVGFAAGEIPRIALNLPLLKDCAIVGAFLASQTLHCPKQFVTNMKDLFDLLLQDKLAPLVTELDCFSQHDTALKHLGDRKALGKVVMRVTAQPEDAAAKSKPASARPAFAEGAHFVAT